MENKNKIEKAEKREMEKGSKLEASSQPALSADRKPAAKDVEIGKEVAKDNRVLLRMQNEKLAFTSALLAFLIVCLVTIFLLIGYIPTGKGECAYQGPFAPYGACSMNTNPNSQIPNPNQNLEEDNIPDSVTGSEDIPNPEQDAQEQIKPPRKEYLNYSWYTVEGKYEFAYPSDWLVQPLATDPNFLFVYSRNPSLPSASINENLSIVPITLATSVMDDAACKTLADNVIKDAQGVFDTITLEEYAPIQINQKDACRISVKSTVDNATARQVQHVFVNKNDPANSYVLTSTQADPTAFANQFYNIIESFTQL